MKATQAYIEQKFDEYNKLIFDGQLPALKLKLGRAKTRLGSCRWKIKRRIFHKNENYDFIITISGYFDLPEQVLEDTIIHEMIHYYIGVNQLKDNSSHGRLFRQMMKDINKRFGRNLSISYKPENNVVETKP